MKNKTIEFVLIILMIIFFRFINIYCALCLFICLTIKCNDFNLLRMEKILFKLKISNQININLDDKLNIISDNKLNFKNKVLYLKGKAKTQIEKTFYNDLSNCINKRQIEILIDWYCNKMKINSAEIYYQAFLITSISFIIYLYFNFYISQLFQIILMLCCIVLLTYEISKLINIYSDNAKGFYKFFIIFYRKLSYLPPLIAYNETLKKSNNKIFQKLFDDINNKEISFLNLDKEKQEICYTLYKVCYTNSLYNQKKLHELYELSLKKDNQGQMLFYKYIFYLLYILLLGALLI